MYKPKNISIKKITQTQPQPTQPQNKNRQSRKSLKIPKRQISPSNFIACINGYLNQLDDGYTQSRFRSREENEIEEMKRKIKKEKSINRSMQKNIMEFQRILWERTEKLELLEQLMRNLENKENNRSLGNSNSQTKSRPKIIKKSEIKQISSQFQNLPSDDSDSNAYEESYDRYKKRRRTEMPAQIQRMISKTMAFFPQREARRKF